MVKLEVQPNPMHPTFIHSTKQSLDDAERIVQSMNLVHAARDAKQRLPCQIVLILSLECHSMSPSLVAPPRKEVYPRPPWATCHMISLAGPPPSRYWAKTRLRSVRPERRRRRRSDPTPSTTTAKVSTTSLSSTLAFLVRGDDAKGDAPGRRSVQRCGRSGSLVRGSSGGLRWRCNLSFFHSRVLPPFCCGQ